MGGGSGKIAEEVRGVDFVKHRKGRVWKGGSGINGRGGV